MKEKTGKGMNDGYNDFLDGVTQVARRNEDEAVEEGLNQVKVGEEISADMGTRVKKARESRGLSVFDLYLRTDIDVDQLSHIEEGKVIPPLGTIIKLAKALDLNMGYFISGKEGKTYTIVRRDDRRATSRYDSSNIERWKDRKIWKK